jgi:hypothetical protein
MDFFDKQTLFDLSVEFLRKQNRKSQKDGPGIICFYRHPDKPEVGCAIRPLLLWPDGSPIERPEVLDFMGDIHNLHSEFGMGNEQVPCLPIFDTEDEDKLTYQLAFLEELQYIHDYQPVEFWESRWRALAKDWELQYREVPASQQAGRMERPPNLPDGYVVLDA